MRTGIAAGIALTFIFSCGAVAQDKAVAAYPSKPIRVIVPFAPGGGLDISTRLIGRKLTEKWGQNIVVDTRPGAATIVGTEIASQAVPDGYTLLMITTTFVINPSVYKKLPYDPLKDFAPVTQLNYQPNVLVVSAAAPAGSVNELIALAKSKPGQLTFATPGAGSAPHLSAELFKRMAGIDMIHVPLRQSPGGEADCLRYSVCPCFQAGYAYEIRCETGMPIVAVGMISTAQHAEALLREGHADLIALARGLMDDPNWPLHAARELGVADPLALVHPREAQRLRQLEHHHRDYPPGSAIEIPFAPEERAAYSWEAGIAGDRSTAEYDARDCSCIDLIDFPALRSPRDAGFFIAGSQPAHALPARPQRAACPKAVPFAVAPRCQVSDPGLCF